MGQLEFVEWTPDNHLQHSSRHDPKEEKGGAECQVLHHINLPYGENKCILATMGDSLKTAGDSRHVMAAVRRRIEQGGERLWRLEDFRDHSFSAAAQALSRLKREGAIERLSKGVYYRPRSTPFGKSRPSPAAIQRLASAHKRIYPAGIAAANLLGFSTQAAGRNEVATTALSLPRKLVGDDTIIHTRRPESWTSLSDEDAALLDFLRNGGRTSELSPAATVQRTLSLLSKPGQYERLLKAAPSEPPRVRAILGAIGEQLRKKRKVLEPLRGSLNPFSRFDFGLLSGLGHASRWQAGGKRG